MTKYREILRLTDLGFTQRNIMASCDVAQKTVVKVQRRAREMNLTWQQASGMTDEALGDYMFPPKGRDPSSKRMPDLGYIHKELLRNGVSKKLLWAEYIEECRLGGNEPLMYSQFCHYVLLDEQKRRATMHISRKPAEQVEVDWAGDPARIADPDTGEIIKAHIFVGVMSYSQYAYVEAFTDEKQKAWITAHVHMYDYFGGVARILVSDNCKTAVVRGGGWYNQQVNTTYYEMAEHYGTAIIPARVRKPKDKPNVEGAVSGISTWITAALRNEQFFTLAELNRAIRAKLEDYNRKPFQKREGSRHEIFHQEEQPLLLPLPAAPYELAEWRTATVQFNYHISIDGMQYSVPFEHIKRRVDVKLTEKTVSVYSNQERIASHCRVFGRKGQYSTVLEHMPPDHQKFIEWDGDRFRRWARQIGESTYATVDAILSSRRVEQQSYKGCMGLLKLADSHSPELLESACEKALRYTAAPSYKAVKNIIVAGNGGHGREEAKGAPNQYGVTRGAGYYKGGGA
jgi:transposase